MKTMSQVVGENLKKIRELSGFTQEEVAKSIGVERSTYSNYEGEFNRIRMAGLGYTRHWSYRRNLG